MSEMKEMRGVECKLEGRDCYVVHADKEVGITVHYLDNDEPAMCINKEEILYSAKYYKTKGATKNYEDIFDEIIEEINKGEIYHRMFHNPIGGKAYAVIIESEEEREKIEGTALTCAYLK